MPLDLTSVRAKLKRADEHLNSVKGEVASRLNQSLYRAVKQTNANSTRYSLILSVASELSFEPVTLIAGDCIHNLRSALDHLVYAIAVHCANDAIPADWNKLAFPIADTAKDFCDLGYRIKSLPAAVWTAIEAVQPYHRPHPELPALLRLLHDFDLADKHRLLNICFGAIHQGHFGKIQNVPFGQEFKVGITMKNLKDGTEIGVLIFDRPTPNVTYDWEGDITVAVSHPRGPNGADISEVSSMLMLLFDEVSAVVDSIAAVVL